jgi:KDO2-lipid IV(A) lauroyltransferase
MSDAEIVAALDRFLGQACIDHADEWLALHDMDLTVPPSCDLAALTR